MIICLSGFVIAGSSPTGMPPGALSARNDISVMERVSVGGAGCERGALGGSLSGALGGPLGGALGGARYSPHHHQLLQHFAPPLASHRGAGAGAGVAARRSSTSSAESASSRSASPPAPPGSAPAAAPRRVRTLYACLGESEGELSFEPNQIITHVAPSGEPGWLRGALDGRHGLVPENYVEPLP